MASAFAPPKLFLPPSIGHIQATKYTQAAIEQPLKMTILQGLGKEDSCMQECFQGNGDSRMSLAR